MTTSRSSYSNIERLKPCHKINDDEAVQKMKMFEA